MVANTQALEAVTGGADGILGRVKRGKNLRRHEHGKSGGSCAI